MCDTPSVLRRGGELGCVHYASCFRARKCALSCLLVQKYLKVCLRSRCRNLSSENQNGEEGDV